MSKTLNSNSPSRYFPIAMIAAFAFAVIVPSSGCKKTIASVEDVSAEEGAITSAVVTYNPAQEFAEFLNWTKVNPEPLYLASELDLLCRELSNDEMKKIERQVHVKKYYTVFVDNVGRDRLYANAGAAFPIGSRLVKQKHVGPDPESSELLTAMVKREDGFAPEVGDWEFFVLDGTAEKVLLQGDTDHCISCHEGQADNDYVFADYLDQTEERRLFPFDSD